MTRFPRCPRVFSVHSLVCLPTPSSMLFLYIELNWIACILYIAYYLCSVYVHSTQHSTAFYYIVNADGTTTSHCYIYIVQISFQYVYLHVFPISSWSFGRLLQFSSLYWCSVQFVVMFFAKNPKIKNEKMFAFQHLAKQHTRTRTHMYTPNQINNNSFECLSHIALVPLCVCVVFAVCLFAFSVGVIAENTRSEFLELFTILNVILFINNVFDYRYIVFILRFPLFCPVLFVGRLHLCCSTFPSVWVCLAELKGSQVSHTAHTKRVQKSKYLALRSSALL